MELKKLKLICKNCNKPIPYKKLLYGNVIGSDNKITSYAICPYCKKWDCWNDHK